MIPCFREDFVYEGFVRAVEVCISLTKGEFKANDYYNHDDYNSGSSSDMTPEEYGVVIFFFVFLISSVILSTRYANKHPEKISSSRSGSSGHGSRSYGGGHFGGGGARGSW
jgi:uncharacterized membrane protein YgcG